MPKIHTYIITSVINKSKAQRKLAKIATNSNHISNPPEVKFIQYNLSSFFRKFCPKF
jgi:hypothetical protein